MAIHTQKTRSHAVVESRHTGDDSLPLVTSVELLQGRSLPELECLPLVENVVVNADDDVPVIDTIPRASLVHPDVPHVVSLNASQSGTVYRRAAFLSVTLFQKPRHLGLAMNQRPRGNRVRISRIEPNSPLASSPLQVGDILISVNGVPCLRKTPGQLGRLLKRLTGRTLTIVAQHREGDPSLVESMVEKPKIETRLGLLARRKGLAGPTKVATIVKNGLLSHTLLNVGDTILSVNQTNCQHLAVDTTMAIVRHSPRYVTFLARSKVTRATVLAVGE